MFKEELSERLYHQLDDLIDDKSCDRKGFSFAIEAARILDLPITICGPSNNKHY